MRCRYMSDLHLESQGFRGPLPKGDVLIVAGDLCHARCLDPERTDKYSADQRSRVQRFVDAALTSFAHVLLVAGNHDHYDGVFDGTIGLLSCRLPGVTVLDNEHVDIGVRFFGSTLWSDFDGRKSDSLNAVGRRRKRHLADNGKLRSLLQAADGNEPVHEVYRRRRQLQGFRYAAALVGEGGTKGVKLGAA
jgi:hypothetical protein